MTLHLSVERTAAALVGTFRIARASQDVADLVHVKLTDGEHTGWGEAAAAPGVSGETTDGVVAQLERVDASQLEPDDVPGSLERVDAQGPAARAALDLALSDLAGKRAGRSVAALLGVDPAERTSSITLPLTTIEGTVAEARRLLAAGHSRFKLKLARDPEPVELTTRVREAIGNAELMVDGNEGFELDEAMALAAKLVELDVQLLEQPLPRGKRDEIERLAAGSPLPIALDESVQSANDVNSWADVDGELVHNIKVQKVGGIHEALACMEAAAQQGRDVLIGCNLESGLGIAAGCQLLHRAALADLDGDTFLADPPFVVERPAIDRVTTPPGPGLGAVRVTRPGQRGDRRDITSPGSG